MSTWAQKKAELTLDWRAAWREIAELTKGEQPADMCRLVLDCDDRYKAGDKSGFVALKAALEKAIQQNLALTGSIQSHELEPRKSMEIDITQDGPTLWDAMTDVHSLSK